ncbi:DUF262 domain-containing HNH endonuclease family protein [Nocardioides sp. YIM 152588]|uniref:DUF262 domain-containing protein n=1 Tax=Nocardioides sp. YIM 152588 TaxID=3158259 RepID=UPI0032E4609A
MPARANRKWSREETVIAFDVFQQHGPANKASSEVVELSNTLRTLAEDRGEEITDNFRNPAGCAMKLGHFLFVTTDGKQGLSGHGAMDREVVFRFRHDPLGLELAAAAAKGGEALAPQELPVELPAGYCTDDLAATPDTTLKLVSTPQIAGTPIVQPALKPLGEMLKNDAPFTIPRYQRSYSWTEDEVIDLARDVRSLAVGVSKGETPQHFFGGVVLVQDPAMGGWNVIDGQQRLTTFLITTALLAAAFDELAYRAKAAGDNATSTAATRNGARLREDFVWINKSDPLTGALDEWPRLSPTPIDHVVFQKLLKGEAFRPTRDSHELLHTARELLWKELFSPVFAEGASESSRLRALLTIQYALFNSSIVIQLTASSLQTAYKLFMVLNDRGMQLSEGDLLRAESLEALEGHPPEQTLAAAAWDEILSFRASTVQGFLRAFYPSVVGDRADIWELVRDYRVNVLKLTSTALNAAQAADLRNLVEQMRDEIVLFDRINRAEWPYASSSLSIGQTVRIRRLVKTLKHELAHPLLLAGAAKMSEKQFLDLVITLERFAFRFKNVGGGHPDAAARVYYPAARGIRTDAKWKLDALRSKLHDLAHSTLPDSELEEALARQLRYDKAGQRNNVRWFLAGLEDFHGWLTTKGKRDTVPSPDTTSVVDADAATIDHIYPQNADKADVDDALEPLKHRVGNLALLEAKDNSIAGNTMFNKKKLIYEKSAVRETSALASKKSWTAVHVVKRESDLITKALSLLDL